MKKEEHMDLNRTLPDLESCYKKLKGTFSNLTDPELRSLLTPDAIRFYKKGEIIYTEGARIKGCYFVYQGIIKIYQTGNEGKEQIIIEEIPFMMKKFENV